MAAMALSLTPLLANVRKNGASFSLGHHREARPHPNPLPQGEGASRFPQSVAHRGRSGPAGSLSAAKPNTASHAHYRRLSTRLIPSMA